MDDDGYLAASQFHVHVHLGDVDSIGQPCHVIRIGRLSHNIQAMVCHHGALSSAVHDDRLKG